MDKSAQETVGEVLKLLLQLSKKSVAHAVARTDRQFCFRVEMMHF
ncbi:MAG: hypothetical protein ACOYL3_02410 [Desulfuromonadaceae bacterium]